MNDLISRQKTIKTIYYYFEDLIKTLPKIVDSDSEKIIDISKTDEYLEIYKAIRELITILPSEKAKTGEWIIDGHHIKCNRCENIMCSRDREGDLIPRNFCSNCGADMRTKEASCDYERAVEQLEHDILYEPTFNQNDGSM